VALDATLSRWGIMIPRGWARITRMLADLAATQSFTDWGAFVLLYLITESMSFDAILRPEKPTLSSFKTTNPS